MAGRLIDSLQSSFAVYEAEPGVFDLYVDAAEPVLDALEVVTPAWRTYLELGSLGCGWANEAGTMPAARAF
jgi:hypothetical protein